MNRRAFCVVLAGAGAACSRRRGPVPLVELAPADTTLLVGARLDSLRNTPTYQRHFASRHFDALERFANETGVDPQRDLTEAVYASDGRDGVLLARGRFDRATGTNLKMLPDGAAASGSDTMLQAVAARVDKPALPDALAVPMRDVGADAQFWTVFTGGAARLPVPDSSNLGNVNTILRTVSEGSFTADLSRGLKARARVLCTAESEARSTADALKALLAIGKASSSGKPDIARAYDAIRVDVQGRTLTASADVAEELVDRLVHSFGA